MSISMYCWIVGEPAYRQHGLLPLAYGDDCELLCVPVPHHVIIVITINCGRRATGSSSSLTTAGLWCSEHQLQARVLVGRSIIDPK